MSAIDQVVLAKAELPWKAVLFEKAAMREQRGFVLFGRYVTAEERLYLLITTAPDEVPINATLDLAPADCATLGLPHPCAFAPTSMAVADFPVQQIRKVFVTMFDSGVILVYDAAGPNQFQLNPQNGGKIFVGAEPRRIVIQPEIVE